jgi:hypothetical protein
MTRDASFKKVVRRHAEETGQRYTEALTDLGGLGARMHHEPVPGRLLAHLRVQLHRSCSPSRVPSVGRRVREGNDGGSPAARRSARASAPVEVPEDIVERVRTLCLALPEVTLRVDYSRTRARSTARSFDIRRTSFCLLVTGEDPTGRRVSLLVLRADPDERAALLSNGYPFFASRAGRDRIVVLLTDDTDWEEIRELVTESYGKLAPKKLTAGLDWHTLAAGPAATARLSTAPGPSSRRRRCRGPAGGPHKPSSGNSPRGTRHRIGSAKSAVPKCASQLRHYDDVPDVL